MALSWKAQELLFQTRRVKLFWSSSMKVTWDYILCQDLMSNLKELILNCELCLKYSQSKCKQQPSMSLGQEIPLHPQTKLDNRHISLWGSILSTNCGLHKQVSCCVQAIIQDRTACCKSVQADIIWVQMTRYFGFWQWTMLPSRNFYKYGERVWCQSYYKLSTLSAIQCFGKNVCPNCQELVLQGKRRGKRSFQKCHDIPQYSLVNQFTISNANLAKQDCKIRSLHVKCCMKTTWFRLRVTYKQAQKWTFTFAWPAPRSRCNIPRCNKQVVVSCYHYKLMFSTMKLQNYYKGRHHL